MKIVTCGISIEELAEKSLHLNVEKERHKFPDALQKIGASGSRTNAQMTGDNKMTILIPYRISKLSLFKDSGRAPCSLLFSRFLMNAEDVYT